MTLRAYRPDDWAEYIKLDLEAAIASGQAYHTSEQGLSRLAWIENRLRDFEVTPRGPVPLLWSITVAVAEGRVVGQVSGVGHGPGSSPMLEITTIGVTAAYRRRGLATALLEDVARAARRAGAPLLMLEVARVNLTALELYAKLGFVEDPEVARARDQRDP